MDSDTFCHSGELVNGVVGNVNDYLFLEDETMDSEDILDACDSAIQEIESWKKAIIHKIKRRMFK